jgi:hypothetical protein
LNRLGHGGTDAHLPTMSVWRSGAMMLVTSEGMAAGYG